MSRDVSRSPDPPLPLDPVGESMAVQRPTFEGGEPGAPSGLHLDRYVSAVLRHKWVILVITALGAVGGVLATRFIEPEYVTQSTLWIEGGSSKTGPIQTEELLQSVHWIDLLKSYTVLDHVVMKQHLFIETADETSRRALEGLTLRERFRPGKYRLRVSQNGAEVRLLDERGLEIERARLGKALGEKVGFDWTPPRRYLKPNQTISFTVNNPRDIAVKLGSELRASIKEKGGNFLSLSLSGTDPVSIARTLNALTDRFVLVAAQLKRAKHDELTQVLDEQRRFAEQNLRDAEIELENFRIQTITLPKDEATLLAPGLQLAQNTAITEFSQMKLTREQLRQDRESIERLLAHPDTIGLTLELLAAVPATQQAPELANAFQERITKRVALRGLYDRYTSEHPAIQKLQEEIRTLEQRTIPRLASQLRSRLLEQEAELDRQLRSASAELREIPPRMIEEARLQRRVTIAENLYTTLRSRYEEARLAAASSIPDIRVLDHAVVPHKPVQDQRPTVILLGFFMGLGVSIVGVMLIDRLDPRVRYPEQITEGMGLPILGTVPQVSLTPSGGPHDQDASNIAEAFRTLRLGLIHAHGTAGPLLLTVTSPETGDGKSFIAANLAVAFAELGHRTLLIDADTRRGCLHRLLEARRIPGLLDCLSGQAPLEAVIQTTRFPSVSLIGAGTRMPNGPELLSGGQMSRVLSEVKSSYSVIIYDSPPLGAGVDPYVLGTVTRNVLLVLRTGTTSRSYATAKLDLLDRLPIRILGAVLNGVPHDRIYRNYAYLAGYQEADEALEPVSGD